MGLVAALGCAGVKPSNTGGGGSSGGGSSGSGNGGTNGGGGSSQPPPPPCSGGQCTDFPADPILDTGVSGDPSGMFPGNPPPSGGPCITEPEDGTLFPNNWLRPRVKFSGTAGKLVQIRMSAANQANTLIAYTTADNWKLPSQIWTGLRGHQIQEAVTVTVWVQGGGASSVKFNTAPVGAGGNLVFWAANPAMDGANLPDCYTTPALCQNASALRGFSVGDESTVEVLPIGMVQQQSRRQDSGNPAPVMCIGCHTATPDSSFVTVIDHYAWRAAVASVNGASTGAQYPDLLTPGVGGIQALQQPGWGPFTYTKNMDFWQPGRRIGIASLGLKVVNTPDWSNGPDQNDKPWLAWINLDGTTMTPPQGMPTNWAYVSNAAYLGIGSGMALGYMQHTGDAGGVATPNWSHDGVTVAYASTNASISGRLNIETANPAPNASDPLHNGTQQNNNPARVPGLTDIYTVPFNNGIGGTSAPVMGAATTQFEEYYPAYSPDDRLIAFTRVPAGQVMYANPSAEIAVINSAGAAEATVLKANDPPACTGKASPGVNNHWPKWSPEVQTASTGKFYWLIFSSNRGDLPPARNLRGSNIIISQLYMAPVVVTEQGIQQYPAIYLWNQPNNLVNTTPAWETFSIPPVP